MTPLEQIWELYWYFTNVLNIIHDVDEKSADEVLIDAVYDLNVDEIFALLFGESPWFWQLADEDENAGGEIFGKNFLYYLLSFSSIQTSGGINW